MVNRTLIRNSFNPGSIKRVVSVLQSPVEGLLRAGLVEPFQLKSQGEFVLYRVFCCVPKNEHPKTPSFYVSPRKKHRGEPLGAGSWNTPP